MQPAEISPEVESAIVSLAANWAKEWADSDLPLTSVINIDKWEEVFSARFNAYYTIVLRSFISAREERQKGGKT
jgi:hypothetical protein